MEFRFVGNEEAIGITGGVAVVVDVMRAYTTAAWALHLGADRILLTDDIEQAVEVASTIEGALLFKDGVPDARFQLHNSPHQLQSLDVAGRTIVQRTTAGTVGAMAARRADHLFCTGYVSARATGEAVIALDPGAVTFVVTGSEGTAAEDLSCAELIAEHVRGHEVDPSSYLEKARSSNSAARLMAAVEAGYEGVAKEDVEMCLELDRFDFAMRAKVEPDGLTLRST